MFPLPSGHSKNKKHLSILAHSPNPVLHTATSELSPLFSPADFLELLRRDDGSSSSAPPSFPTAGTSRLSPFSASFPASGPPFGYYGSSPAEDEPFRFSLEVDASGHATMLPLQLAAPSPVAGASAVIDGADDSQPGPSLLSPFHFGPYPVATSPTSPPHTTFSPPSSLDSSHSSVDLAARYDAGPSLTVFPSRAFGPGLGVGPPALETQSETSSPTTVPGLASMRPPRPVLVSRNSAPAIAPQQQDKESASPKVRKALLKQKRSMSNLRDQSSLSTASSPRAPESTNPSPIEATAAPTSSLASLLPIMPREDLPSVSKKNHNSNRSANYTPRPPNSWILYRSETIKQMKLAKERGEVFPIPDAVKSHPDVASGDGVMAQADVSKMVALMWKLEGKDVKLKYDQLSAIRKLEHAEMYPGYKYQPARKAAATPAVVKAKVPARRPAPPLVMYPSTTPRSQDLAPAPAATASSALAAPAGRASQESSAGKHRTLKKKKKSRSTLSSRATSPAQASPSGLPASAPIEWSYSHPMPAAPAWPHVPPQPWVIPPPADAHYFEHPHPSLPTPPDHPHQSFEVPSQVWVSSPQSPDQQQPYYPIYLSTPPDTAVGTPHGMYPAPAHFNVFAPQAGPLDYNSPAHSETPSTSSSYLQETYMHPEFGAQMSPPPPPAPHASFDGVAYTQVISESYDGDLSYHAVDVDGRPAEAFVATTTESSLAATWSLLEDVEADEPHEAATDSPGWSTQGDWMIDSHDHRWPSHRQ